MTKTDIPPHMVLHESKEVIFYSKKSVPSDLEINRLMKKFPNDYKGMVIQNACFFKRLKEQTENQKQSTKKRTQFIRKVEKAKNKKIVEVKSSVIQK